MNSVRKIYVAVVDDDESVCRALGRSLRANDLQVVTYLSAEAFLEDAKRPKFDCLVLDIQLGGMSGLELSERLAAVQDRTPIIFNTTHDKPALRAQAQALGCVGYFRKADPAAYLLATIRRAVGLQGPDSSPEP